ncbi:MAG: KilA-N domain-containing protein [Symploca sp. SIO2E6]|nr:KilA-N domain-containing protein [Symploca sp. SIO2E6]
MGKVVKFQRYVNGFCVEQRKSDGFVNATAMCVAHDKDIAQWFLNRSTLALLNALARRFGKVIFVSSLFRKYFRGLETKD